MAIDFDREAFRHINLGSREERRRTAQILGPGPPPASTASSALPATRGDCPEFRPCPHVSCRHHYGVDAGVIGNSFAVRVAVGFFLVMDNCALDFVEDHPDGATLEEVGAALLLTRERVRQIEESALQKVRSTKAGREFLDAMGDADV